MFFVPSKLGRSKPRNKIGLKNLDFLINVSKLWRSAADGTAHVLQLESCRYSKEGKTSNEFVCENIRPLVKFHSVRFYNGIPTLLVHCLY